MNRKNIMTSANLRASIEGRSQALKKSHKATKGVIIYSGKTYQTLRQRSRLESSFKAGDKVEDTELELDFDVGMVI